MQELKDGMAAVIAGGTAVNKVFAHPLPYNIIPHIDVFQANAYTKEEMKVTLESRKIMDCPELKMSCTAVRIPTLRAHSEAITLETERPITANEVRELLAKAPGVKVVDDPANKKYPMPLTATNQWDVEVGRIRENDVFGDKGLDLFVCGDQLLRGAALNAVIIAEVSQCLRFIITVSFFPSPSILSGSLLPPAHPPIPPLNPSLCSPFCSADDDLRGK